jgi:general secretion pathway protein G
MKRLGRKRWAFTLVEILIVLLLIGILAGALMLVSFSVTAKAEATRIVEDMRAMKSAAMLYYADFGLWPVWMKSGTTIRDANNRATPDKYLESIPLRGDHWVGVAGVSGDLGEATVIFVSTSVSPTTLERLGMLGSGFPLYGMTVTGRITAIPDNPDVFDASTHNAALWYIRKKQ